MKTYLPQPCSGTIRGRILTTTVMALAACSCAVFADDAKPDDKKEEPKKSKWESTATAGVTMTRGNSHTFLATAALATKRTWTNNEALLGASAGYGENRTTVNGTKVDTTTDSYVRGYG